MVSTFDELKQQVFSYTIQKELIDEANSKKIGNLMVLTDILVRSNIVELRVH